MKRLSLRVKLILVMLASALPATLVAAGALFFAQDLARTEQQGRLVELGSWIANHQENNLESFIGVRDMLLRNPLDPLNNPQICRAMLRGADASVNGRFSFLVFNADGVVICAAGEAVSQALMERINTLVETRPAAVLSQDRVDVFFDREGALYRSHAAHGAQDYLIYGIYGNEPARYSERIEVFARKARVLLYDPSVVSERAFTVEQGGWLPADMTLQNIPAREPVLLKAFNGEEYFYYKRPGNTGQFVTLVGSSAEDLRSGLSNLILLALLAPFFFLALTLVAGWLAVHQLVLRWIARLEKATRDYGRGDAGARVHFPPNVPHEIASLGEAFNSMADNVGKRTTETRLALAGRASILNDFHHHVKNNFQVIASLMTLESRRMDPERAATLQHQHDRVQAMASAYKAAFAQGEGAKVSLNSLFDDISRLLRYSFKFSNRQCLVIPLFHDVELTLERAVPLGLMMVDLIWQGFAGHDTEEEADSTSPVVEIELSGLDDDVTICLRRYHGSLRMPDDFGITLIQGYLIQIDARSELRPFGEDGSEIVISFAT